MDMDRTRLAAALVFSLSIYFTSSQAMAGCEQDINDFAPTMTTSDAGGLAPAVMSEALALFDQASALCAAGDEEGALQKIAEAKALLGVQD